RRTTGETNPTDVRPAVRRCGATAGAGSGRGAAAGAPLAATTDAAGSAFRAGAGVGLDTCGCASAPSITATTVWTGTVSPSVTRISLMTPAAGDGISASTLSVEISK